MQQVVKDSARTLETGSKKADSSKEPAACFTSWEFWKGHLAYKATSYKTTWKFRFLVVALLLALPLATKTWWVPALGRSLVCNSEFVTPDLIIIDNLDSDYLLFEKAADLKEHGVGEKVLVPVDASGRNPQKPNLVSREVAEVMIRVAGLGTTEIIPIKQEEPITLNAARQVGEYLKGTNVKKVLILTSGFKSKRIHLIFKKALSEVGIDEYCLPVWGSRGPENWAASWHGIQEVFLQHVKLAYYRLWVL
jgi:hypothetical protein